MKKYIQLLTITLLLSTATFAQITITASDLNARFVVGKSIVTNADATTKSLNIGGKGNFGTVDFSTLKVSEKYTSTSVAPSSSSYTSGFTGATVVLKNDQKQSGVASTNYMFLSVSDFYYWYGTATETVVSGFAATIKTKFSVAQQIYKLPIAYSGTNTQQVSQDIETTLLGFPTKITNQYKEVYTVDGYGKMKTPEGKTVDVLRIKNEITLTTAQNISNTTTNYVFIAKTGESASITPKAGSADNGAVQIDGLSWNDGDGTTNPTAVEKTKEVPASFTLGQNYPNPFNPTTKISFSIPQQSNVSLKVYNVIGSEVANLVQGNLEVGTYNVEFNASHLASGIYIYTINANNFSQSKKMILTK